MKMIAMFIYEDIMIILEVKIIEKGEYLNNIQKKGILRIHNINLLNI